MFRRDGGTSPLTISFASAARKQLLHGGYRRPAETARPAAGSLGGEGSEEVVEVLLLGVLGGLELLDVSLVLLDLGLLLVELLQVALVRLGRAGHLFQVGAQPGLV